MNDPAPAPPVDDDVVEVEYENRRPVRWLSVPELVQTGKEVQKATIAGHFDDGRLHQGNYPSEIYELSSPSLHDMTEGQAFEIDYTADTGDGFNATYAVARSLTGQGIGPGPKTRGHLLILGGDEVYPYASAENYRDRLHGPFKVAEGGLPETGMVLAIPGNHDWYDAATGFMEIFGRSWTMDATRRPPGGPPKLVDPSGFKVEAAVGRWAFQSRSYFAARLPHGWWLWGVDSQLKAHMDAQQEAYFEFARTKVEPHERVIICSATPSWTHHPGLDTGYYGSDRETFTWFVNRFFSSNDQDDSPDRLDDVRIVISGDKHHYAHYTKSSFAVTAPGHAITCGGAGAYLSSTHKEKKQIRVPWHLQNNSETTYERGVTYPSVSRSRWGLRAQFLRIPFLNGIITPALLIMVNLGLAFLIAMGMIHDTKAVWVPAGSAVTALALLLMGLSIALRPHQRSVWISWSPGLVHAATYILADAYLAHRFLDRHIPEAKSIHELWSHGHRLALVENAAAVALAAPVIFALYFVLCDVLIHWHENELFAGMRFAGYKSHVRISVSPPDKRGTAGDVHVTVYGVRKSPNNRRKRSGLNQPEVIVVDEFDVPANPDAGLA